MTIELGMNPSTALIDCILEQIGLGRYVRAATGTTATGYAIRGRVLPV